MSDWNSETLDALPFPVWQVYAHASTDLARSVRIKGVTDVGSYLISNEPLVEETLKSVVVEKANSAAARLFAAENVSDLLQPVHYMFTASPAARRRVLQSRFAGCHCHLDEFKIHCWNGKSRQVIFFAIFPGIDTPEEKGFAMMFDVTPIMEMPGETAVAGMAFGTEHQAISSLAHDIRQPLATILASAETARAWLQRSPPDVAKALQQTNRIISSTDRAKHLLESARISTAASYGGPDHLKD